MRYCIAVGVTVLLIHPLAAQEKKGQPDFDGLKALRHPDPDVRYSPAPPASDLGPAAEAALALGEIGPAAKGAVPALLATLKSDEVLLIEPFVLGTLGKIGEPAVPALIEALVAKEYRLRHGAAYALALIGPGAADAVA